jgi:hypothetical protein
MNRSLSAAFILAAAASGSPLPAQGPGVSLTPYLGVYAPVTDAARIGDGTIARQEASLAVGARVGIPIHGRLGLELVGEYAPSDLRIRSAADEQSAAARVVSSAARITWSILEPSEGIDLQVSGGAALIHHGGAAYSTRENPARLGGALGASAGFRVGRSLRLRVGVEDYVYRSNLTPTVAPVGPVPLTAADLTAIPLDAPSEYRRTQHDMHLTIGFTIR